VGQERRVVGGPFRAHEKLEDPLIQRIFEALDLRAAESLELGKSDPAALFPPAGRDPEDQGSAADRLRRIGVVHDLGFGVPGRPGAPKIGPYRG
jgi:hypothetical protein